MPQKPALFLSAVLGAQFTAGGIHPWSLASLAFIPLTSSPPFPTRGPSRRAATLRSRSGLFAAPPLQDPGGGLPLVDRGLARGGGGRRAAPLAQFLPAGPDLSESSLRRRHSRHDVRGRRRTEGTAEGLGGVETCGNLIQMAQMAQQ